MMKILMRYHIPQFFRHGVVAFALTLTLSGTHSLASAQNTPGAQVQTTSAGLSAKVAPGDLLPVSIKLANFGNDARIDVQVHYQIANNHTGKVVLASEETVAVETTDNFVRNLQVPAGIPSGRYTATAYVTYQGQKAPATTSFAFQVEPKILGVFEDQFYLYGSIAVAAGFVLLFIGQRFARRGRATRLQALDYRDVPRSQRVFYELVSDTVMNMRQQVGQQALDVAARVEGLKIDTETGRVLGMEGSPSKIVADLVAGYEKTLDKRVSFSFRSDKTGIHH